MSLTVQDIFDLENIVPAAVKTVLKANGFQAFTAMDDPTNQRPRPRVDIFFKTGAAPVSGGQAQAAIVNGQRINAAWTGELILHAVTAVDAPGKLVHAAYRATLRYIMQTLIYNINGVPGGLNNHRLQLLVESGTTHGIRTQDGYEQSTISYSAMISVQTNAWSQIVFNGTNFGS